MQGRTWAQPIKDRSVRKPGSLPLPGRYPQTLVRRIRDLASVRSSIRFVQGDAFEILETNRADAVFFIDPPYTVGGKKAGSRLYNHSEIDHERLFALCAQMHGHFLMTYDNTGEARALAARHGFETRPVAMKNTHHARMTELLVGRDFAWMEHIVPSRGAVPLLTLRMLHPRPASNCDHRTSVFAL